MAVQVASTAATVPGTVPINAPRIAGFMTKQRRWLSRIAGSGDRYVLITIFPIVPYGCPIWRFAARRTGLASGLALAVRPSGLAEAPGSTARRRRVPRSGTRSTVEAGGTSPDNARRSGPLAVTSSGDRRIWRNPDGPVVVLAGAAAGYGGDSRRPVAGGAVRGSRRAVGLAAEGRGEKLPPRNGETPRVNPGHLRRVTLAAYSLSTARARLWLFTARAVRPGAPKVRP